MAERRLAFGSVTGLGIEMVTDGTWIEGMSADAVRPRQSTMRQVMAMRGSLMATSVTVAVAVAQRDHPRLAWSSRKLILTAAFQIETCRSRRRSRGRSGCAAWPPDCGARYHLPHPRVVRRQHPHRGATHIGFIGQTPDL